MQSGRRQYLIQTSFKIVELKRELDREHEKMKRTEITRENEKKKFPIQSLIRRCVVEKFAIYILFFFVAHCVEVRKCVHT